jgi:hypothetical protein
MPNELTGPLALMAVLYPDKVTAVDDEARELVERVRNEPETRRLVATLASQVRTPSGIAIPASKAPRVHNRPRERRSGSTRPPRAGPGDDSELPRACEVCGASLAGKRRHAKTCSTRCRVARHRSVTRLQPLERAALEARHEAALRIIRSLSRDERWDLLRAVVWPSDPRLAASNLREAA